MEIAFPHPGSVDLHIHSTASDGSLSPQEIIHTAEKLGLRAVAITDHDTVEGSAEAFAMPPSPCLEVLSGVEVSVNHAAGTIHILGYLIELDDKNLIRTLQKVQDGRVKRNIRIVEKLQGLGVDMDYQEVVKASGGGQVGRPHFARVLVNKGAARSVEEAFKRFLRRDGPAYVSRYRLQAAEAMEMILEAGGLPVLAHPFTLNAREETEMERILRDLKDSGLKGLEVYYPEHGRRRTAQYERLARRLGLLRTGGTDFHGAVKPGVQIGTGRGDLNVPYELVVNLKKERARLAQKKVA
jgi:hypothetical protein